jgi:hypothetical protein
MEKIWECKIGGKVGDMPAGADGPMRRAVQTAFKTLTGVEASFTFSGWGATLTEFERAVHENRAPNCGAMQEAIDAGDGTLHGAIEYWHEEALRLRAELAECIAALEKITNPISAMKRALPVGATLNGAMATTLSNDPSYLKEIAKAALAARKGEDA